MVKLQLGTFARCDNTLSHAMTRAVRRGQPGRLRQRLL